MSIQTYPAPAAVEQTGPSAARNLRFDPVTRVSGGFALHAAADFSNRTVRDAAAMATTFRGYENLLAGRDARDAVFVSSRACGVCGSTHAIASAHALEQASGITPPPHAITARNMLTAADCMIDHPSALFLRAGPDYSEPIVRATSPELWSKAESTRAANVDVHGYANVSEIMTEMTRNSGFLYREALHLTRQAREAYVTVGGKYPHPQTITPGGVSSTVDITDYNLSLLRIVKFLDYSRRVTAVWDDLVNFFYSADAGYTAVGAGPKNFLDLGLWDDPGMYDNSFGAAFGGGGEGRWSPPAAIVDGVLQTTGLQDIDAGVEEFVDHSFYDGWSGIGLTSLSPQHPSNKQTLPNAGATNADGRYSWSTAARWQGHAMETGAAARLWATALAGGRQARSSFVEGTGRSVRISLPAAAMPANVIEWQVPQHWNALERNRARAYALAQATMAAYESVVVGLDITRKGGPNARIFNPYKIPKDALLGAGYWGGGRGYVSHHLHIDGRVIQNYQIVGPSTFTGSPRDAAGRPGPCEAAVMATPLVTSDASRSGIDVLRAIRSFDLCMYCATQ